MEDNIVNPVKIKLHKQNVIFIETPICQAAKEKSFDKKLKMSVRRHSRSHKLLERKKKYKFFQFLKVFLNSIMLPNKIVQSITGFKPIGDI